PSSGTPWAGAPAKVSRPAGRKVPDAFVSLAGPEPPGRSSPRLAVMFRCQLCQCVVPPRTPSQRLVLQRRSKKYPHRCRANVVVRQRADDKKPKKEYVDDPGGAGQEIVHEVTVCPACAVRNGRR